MLYVKEFTQALEMKQVAKQESTIKNIIFGFTIKKMKNIYLFKCRQIKNCK